VGWLETPGIENRVPVITAGIRDRLCLRLGYNGGPRIVAPCVLGRGHAGQWLFLAWQFAGASLSCQPVGMKMFRVDRIESLHLLDATFDAESRAEALRGYGIAYIEESVFDQPSARSGMRR
jgi:hypothetical protein